MHRLFPFDDAERWPERLVIDRRGIPIWCPVCARPSVTRRWTTNVRESGACFRCGATNRDRQLASALLRTTNSRRLPELARSLARIHNTQAHGAIHAALSRSPSYSSSEYFGPNYESGELVRGVRHEDITSLTHPDESLDIFLTSDVLEHVPEPVAAQREIYRVLRPGGTHIFTVPFDPAAARNLIRAVRDDAGNVQYLRAPLFHGDPLRPDGILVFAIFGLEMLTELEELGFVTTMWCLRSPVTGILGSNSYVFSAVKATARVHG